MIFSLAALLPVISCLSLTICFAIQKISFWPSESFKCTLYRHVFVNNRQHKVVITVWRVNGNTIRTVLCCTVFNRCVHWYALCTHTWAVLQLTLGLCLHLAQGCDNLLSNVTSLKLVLTNQQNNTLLSSVVWHCWLGNRKRIRVYRN